MKGIICIGRQYGSGGREVGEKLARKLGIPCYDKLLIKKAALESGLSTDFISKTSDRKDRKTGSMCDHWSLCCFHDPEGEQTVCIYLFR